jgi:hypothetical protein
MSEAEPSADAHPIAKIAMACLKTGPGGRFLFDPAGSKRLAQALAKIEGTADKRDALKELVALAWFLDKKKDSADAARRLLDVADGASQGMRLLGEELYADSEKLHAEAMKYERMLGEVVEKRAPMVGEEEPEEGTVKAGYLGDRRRM